MSASTVCAARPRKELNSQRRSDPASRASSSFAGVSTTGDRADLADVPEDAPVWARRDLDARQLPRPELPRLRRLLRHARAPQRARRRRGGDQPSPLLRRRGAARRGHRRAAAVVQHRGLRRGAPAAPRRRGCSSASTLSSTQLDRARARRARSSCAPRGGASPDLDRLAGALEQARARPAPVARRAGRAPVVDAGDARRRIPGRGRALHGALAALNAPLQEQAERSEGLGACARRSSEALGVLARLREERGSSGRTLGRGVRPVGAASTSRRSRRPSSSRRQMTRPPARLDLHLGHARRRRGLRPFHARARRLRGRGAPLGEPVRFRRAGAALRAEGPAGRSERSGVHRRGDRGGRCRCSRRAAAARSCSSPRSRALRRAHELLKGRLSFPLLVQGTGSRSELLERFRALGNAVLLGSQSFWEGVDVRGEALSLVVIDKLPFAPPDDPVLAARIEATRTRGRQPVQRAAAAAGGAAAEAGRGAADPRRDRPRRADALRSAPRLRRATGGRSCAACRR